MYISFTTALLKYAISLSTVFHPDALYLQVPLAVPVVPGQPVGTV
jgi:hypothetical protein